MKKALEKMNFHPSKDTSIELTISLMGCLENHLEGLKKKKKGLEFFRFGLGPENHLCRKLMNYSLQSYLTTAMVGEELNFLNCSYQFEEEGTMKVFTGNRIIYNATKGYTIKRMPHLR